MVRLLKFNANIKKILDLLNMNPGITKMITVAVTVFFLVHLISCFWFLTAKFEDFSPNTWVVLTQLQDSSPTSQYLASMYWAF